MKKSTRVNHPPRVDLAPDNHPVVAPIYQTVKFEFDSLDETMKALRGERPGFFYTRSSNPTTRQLELTLAELQGPVLDKAHTAFRYLWQWQGGETEIMSRAVDETGYVQPGYEELAAARDSKGGYHFNPVTSWSVQRNGKVMLRLS